MKAAPNARSRDGFRSLGPSSRPSRVALALGLAALLSASCDGDSVPPPAAAAESREVIPHVFVGHVEGSGSLIALVEGEESLVAYSCGTGDQLSTHTGWYFGVRSGSDVQLVNGVSGLRVQGSLSESGGAGTLTLADGSEVRWTAEPARGDAGLYDFEDAANLVGFIRANDGATAGNSVGRVGTGGVAVTTTSPSSAPVTPAPAPPPPPSGTPPAPAVSFDNGLGTRIVTTRPVLNADQRVIKRTGPVVVFLMHGMSDNFGTLVKGDTEDIPGCAGPRDTPFYGRCEWGQDFLPGLFGSENIGTQLVTLDGRDVTGDRFLNDPKNRQQFDETLGQTMSGDCVADPRQTEVPDPRAAMHFVAPRPLKDPPKPVPGFPSPPPPLSAFVTWRDSTRGLVFSGRRVTRQVYAALRWYETTYKVTPGVILVAQSFGGLASRFMLSRPDPATLTGPLNFEKVTLCKEDLAKMDYVRDRTLYLVTLSTPHEGSYMSEWGVPAKSFLTNLVKQLQGALADSPLSKVIRALDTIATLLLPDRPLDVLDQALAGVAGMADNRKSAALADMRLATMDAFNRGPLAPTFARRTGASPILGAAKTLIPVYATLARSPGADVFDSPDLAKSIETYPTKRPKAQGWILSTTLVADPITRQFVPGGFGDATVAPYGPFRAILDRRARLFDSSPTTTQIEQKFGADLTALLAAVSPWFLGRFGRDTDAVLTALQGDVSVALPHVLIPIHTSQKWKLALDAIKTVEVPMPAFECGGARIVLDDDALARKLVDAYGNTAAVFAKIVGGDLRGLLEGLGAAIQSDNALAQAASQWFVGQVAALGSLPAECNTKPDDPFDIFAITELANWKIVETTGLIPAPAWIGTGEPVSDGEMDTDGAVHSASALGFTLGKQPFFFEHDRTDDGGKRGSWYRLYDNPATEGRNHGLQYENAVGLWVFKDFFAANVGPVAAASTFSVWPQ